MNMYRIFSQIWNMSLTASIVILIVLAARLLLKKAPKIFSYALWAVVLFRLLCPVSLPANVSLFNAFETPIARVENIGYTPFMNVNDLSKTDIPQADISKSNVNGDGGTNLTADMNENQAQINETMHASEITPMEIGTYIWLGGIAVMLVYSIVSLTKLRRKLVGAVRVRDNIYLSDHIPSPFVKGLFSPKIYLPSTLPEWEQNYIIQHEQHHIRRFDHIVKIVAFAALCIHWFNPLVWMAFILAGNDMEMSCDEAVMKKIENDIRADYSASLLTLATGKKMIAGTPLAFGAGNTKERVHNVMKYKKPAFWVGIAAAMCLVIVSAVLIFNPKEEKEHTYDIAVDFLTEYYERIYTGKEKDTSLVKCLTTEVNNDQEKRIAERQKVMKATGGYVKDLQLSFEQAKYEEREGKVILTVNLEASFQYPNAKEKSGFGGNAVFEISKQGGNYVISGCQIQDGSGDYILGGELSVTMGDVPPITSYAIYKVRTSEKSTGQTSGRYTPEITLYSNSTFEFSYNIGA